LGGEVALSVKPAFFRKIVKNQQEKEGKGPVPF